MRELNTLTMAFVCASPAALLVRPAASRRNTRAARQQPLRHATRMEFTLDKPPYELDALEPHMSKQTMEFHWGKHHQTYVTNVNNLVKGTEDENKSMEEIMMKASGGLFNNAAQVWNHDFFWQSMKPGGGGEPTGKLAEMITASFGSFAEFKEKFCAAGAPGPAFGSGWIWLVEKDGKLAIEFTKDAQNPLAAGTGKPLITYDVWEHAYYLDHQNLRPRYITTFMDNLVNWDKASERLG
jgi:Fe-Mn family superoxide dismutase